MGDDVQVQTKDWDQLIADEFLKYEERFLIVVPADGRPKNVDKLGDEVKL